MIIKIGGIEIDKLEGIDHLAESLNEAGINGVVESAWWFSTLWPWEQLKLHALFAEWGIEDVMSWFTGFF